VKNTYQDKNTPQHYIIHTFPLLLHFLVYDREWYQWNNNGTMGMTVCVLPCVTYCLTKL